ncbi:hypothetical protein D3C76_1709320 [compost metagenome]
MSNQRADVVAVSRLEARIDPRAKFVPVKPPKPCKWDDSEVLPLRQDGPLDPVELLFVGLTSQRELECPKAEHIRTISTRVVTSPSRGDKYLS